MLAFHRFDPIQYWSLLSFFPYIRAENNPSKVENASSLKKPLPCTLTASPETLQLLAFAHGDGQCLCHNQFTDITTW